VPRIVGSLAVMLAAGVLLAGLAGCGGGGRLPYAERFSGSCANWPTQDDRLLKAGCSGGEYRVLVRDARNVQFFTVPVSVDGVKVEVDVRVAAGHAPRRYGIGCFHGDRSGVWAVVTPGSGYEIVDYSEEPQSGIAHAYSLSEDAHAISAKATYHLRADCGPPNIVMWVDGRMVLAVPDAEALAAGAVGEKPSPFKHVGVVVFPSTSATDVRFDNFTVQRLPPSGTASEHAFRSYALVPKWAKQQGFGGNMEAIDGATEFVQAGCLSCHTYLGTGSSHLGAPDLSTEGRKHRALSWQIAHLKCPACRVAGSPMPSFAGLNPADLHVLAAFLEESKGRCCTTLT
jgi:Cytochrome c